MGGLDLKFAHIHSLIADGRVVFEKIQFQETERVFSATQLLAMYFTKIKEITEAELKSVMTDFVMSIPVYFGDAQRRAVLDAAEMAGMNCLRLIHDTSAAALQWGITKTDLPEEHMKFVAFVDLGHSDYTVSIVGFQKGKMVVRGGVNGGGGAFRQWVIFASRERCGYLFDCGSCRLRAYRTIVILAVETLIAC